VSLTGNHADELSKALRHWENAYTELTKRTLSAEARVAELERLVDEAADFIANNQTADCDATPLLLKLARDANKGPMASVRVANQDSPDPADRQAVHPPGGVPSGPGGGPRATRAGDGDKPGVPFADPVGARRASLKVEPSLAADRAAPPRPNGPDQTDPALISKSMARRLWRTTWRKDPAVEAFMNRHIACTQGPNPTNPEIWSIYSHDSGCKHTYEDNCTVKQRPTEEVVELTESQKKNLRIEAEIPPVQRTAEAPLWVAGADYSERVLVERPVIPKVTSRAGGVTTTDDILCEVSASDARYGEPYRTARENAERIAALLNAAPRPSEAKCTCGAPRGSDHGITCPAPRSDTPDERSNEAKPAGRFSVGDRVCWNEDLGEIVERHESDPLAWRVRWANGNVSSYQEKQLVLVGGRCTDNPMNKERK